tara:strand:- start:1675 stop:1794 length:120 start_codon:yes stop_codon:yes gene_type:complete
MLSKSRVSTFDLLIFVIEIELDIDLEALISGKLKLLIVF